MPAQYKIRGYSAIQGAFAFIFFSDYDVQAFCAIGQGKMKHR